MKGASYCLHLLIYGGIIMLLIQNSNTNPYFNLALEEYLIMNMDEDCISLWINEAVIVVGKNQNALAEINLDYVRQNSIKVVRRLTGGGAVFHDIGNINFTYVQKNSGERFNDYAHFTRDIVAYLSTLGVKAELSGRNDLTIKGKKFSGNAQCVKNGKIMHHGTILYSANLSRLAGALNANPLKIESKGIKSVSSRVTNVIEHMFEKIDVDSFKGGLEAFMIATYPQLVPYELTQSDIAEVDKLVTQKYNTWDWNFGTSPNYNFHNIKKFDSGIVEVSLNVADGIILNIKINGDFFGTNDVVQLEKALTGTKHNPQDVEKAFKDFEISDYIVGLEKAKFIELFS